MFFSVFAPAITLAIAIAIAAKNSMKPNETGSIVTLSVSSPLYLTAFFYYVYQSFRENYPLREFIKPTRIKYFHSGLVSAFSLFGSYLALWVVAYKTEKDWVWYIDLGLVMLFGLITTIYISLYEFCISFDVFYSKNKRELVHNFLEKATGKKLDLIAD
ncbi:hypothetical protein [Candidatus Mycoplasma haematominutum]|uniref:Uncharacterized protein n=1 Tax=Candidatus Mycoplasma haematominutum 'Birmingham 1' TaxID=1116213 RepID=G8C2W7_9MOLU|nr:hypothetical protein [Candidatus Mycoplasma haematominutum]CCE66665.1 conserved haemoplasma hypothetical protein [Candidatus Mycoplasma haematominutum 'Birmingham 1']